MAMDHHHKPEKESTFKAYQGRINRVMDHIENHIEAPLTLDDLSRVACFSKYHFHRIFKALTGESLFGFIQRVRVEKAAMRLNMDPDAPVTRIALDCGFSDSAAFAKRFKQRFGMAPTQWRKTRRAGLAEVISRAKNFSRAEVISRLKNDSGTPASSTMPDAPGAVPPRVSIQQLESMTIAYIRYIGPYKGDAGLFERLYRELFSWALPRHLVPEEGVDCISMYHDDLEITSADHLRVSIGIRVPPATQVDENVSRMVLHAGTYACARFIAGPDDYAPAWDWIYRCWLPQSGFLPDDRPSFEFFPGTENIRCTDKRIVDICVPVRPIE